MTRRLARLHLVRRCVGRASDSDRGMSTAEYAIGTLAACGFAGRLVTILRSSAVQELLLGIIKKALAVGG